MNTQANTKVSRKSAAAAKFATESLAAAAAADAAAPVETAPVGVVDPAKTGLGLTAAKSAVKRASRAKVVKGEAAVLEMAPATVEVAAPAKAPRSRKAKAAPAEFVPTVVKDASNHSAIAVNATDKMVDLIPMDSAGMSVTQVSRDRFAADYKEIADYPAAKAARVYLTQSIAMDPKAREVLELLAASEADKPIASGVLVALMSKHDETAAAERAAAAAAAPATVVVKVKAPRAAAAPKADRQAKPLGRSKVGTDKVLAKGEVDYKSKVRPGTFRFALMEAIVAAAATGAKAESVLGKVVMEGKPGVAAIDITFAVQCKYVSFAA